MEVLAALLLVLGGSVGIFILLLLSSLINGWALSILWAWFIVPVFSIPALSLGQAIGVAMVVSFLTWQHIDAKSSDESGAVKFVTALMLTVGRPVFAVLFGMVIKQLFGI